MKTWLERNRPASTALIATATACVLWMTARTAAGQGTIPRFGRCDVPVNATPGAMASGDFNRDGNPDLAVIDDASNKIVVLLMDRSRLVSGHCPDVLVGAQEVTLVGRPVAIAVGKIDQDNIIDLVVAVQAGVVVLVGDMNGHFTAQTPVPAGLDPQAVAVADVDGDGHADIVVGNGSGNSVTILYGRAGGGFDAALPMTVDGPVTFMAVGDLNKDSFIDIAAGSNGTGKVSVFLQDKTNPRVFRALTPFTVGVAPTAMVTGDFDRNGSPDLAVASGGSQGKLTILLSNLPGSEATPFTAGQPVSSGASPSAVGVEQLNRDFPLYVAVANQDESTVAFLSSDGTGRVTEVTAPCVRTDSNTGRCTVGSRPGSMVLADVDGDGRSDVITGNQADATLSLLLSSLPAATAIPTAFPTSTPTATPSFTATATPTPGGDCCTAHDSASCNDSPCRACVCDLDSPCCNTGWDDLCVHDAVNECASSCPCGPSTPTPTITSSPTAPTTTPVPSDCCQCDGPRCGPALGTGADACGNGCQRVLDASCGGTGECVVHTPTSSPTATASTTPTLSARPTQTPSPTSIPSSTPTDTPAANNCCQCGPPNSCGPPSAAAPGCGDCMLVLNASCGATGECVTHTPVPTFTDTPTPTPLRTIKPTPTPTPSATPPAAATLTRTPTTTQSPTPQCFSGGVCIQGKGCAVTDGGESTGSAVPWLLAPLILFVRRLRGR